MLISHYKQKKRFDFRHQFRVWDFRKLKKIPKLSFDIAESETYFGIYRFRHPTLNDSDESIEENELTFTDNGMEIDSDEDENFSEKADEVNKVGKEVKLKFWNFCVYNPSI